MKIAVIDLGVNNLESVVRAFEAHKNQFETISVITEYEKTQFDLIVLPGVGHFGFGMECLNQRGLATFVLESLNTGAKLVGFCLGMQLLANESEEAPGVTGLSIINAKVVKFQSGQGERIPFIGWAPVRLKEDPEGFDSLALESDYYFVHSYHVVVSDPEEIMSKTGFAGTDFVSSIQTRNVLGFQFHPEKSGKAGNLLIAEILKWANCES